MNLLIVQKWFHPDLEAPAGGGGAININASIGAFSWAGKTSGLSRQIAATVGAISWSGKSSSLATQIAATKGAITWVGKVSSLATQIGATKGAYTWAGLSSPLAKQIGATVGPITWQGTRASFGGAVEIAATVGTYAYLGKASSLQINIGAQLGLYQFGGTSAVMGTLPTPTPTPAPAGTGAQGGTDYRWYEGQELRPNWYHYPEVKKLKRELVKAAKAKQKLERDLSFAKGPEDWGALMASLNLLQERIAALLEQYRAMHAAWQAAVARRAEEEEEEAEFMDLLRELL